MKVIEIDEKSLVNNYWRVIIYIIFGEIFLLFYFVTGKIFNVIFAIVFINIGLGFILSWTKKSQTNNKKSD